MNDVSLEMKRLLDYIDGQASSDKFTQELETAVRTIKNNERWRVEYMTLEMRYKELLEQGFEEGLEQGVEQGIAQTITTMISLLKENEFSNSKITEVLVNKFNLSPEEAEKYITKI